MVELEFRTQYAASSMATSQNNVTINRYETTAYSICILNHFF